MNDAEVKLKVKIDSKDAEKGINDLGSKADKLAKNFTDAGTKLTVGLTAPITAFGGYALKSAMDLEKTESKYNTVFDGMTDTVDDFINEFQKLTPATTAEARSMYSSVQDLLVPMGFAREEATQLTGEFMEVAGALTNFNSATHSAQDVTNALSSALTGQYKPLQNLGIVTNKQAVQQKAVEMGLAETTDEVNKQMEAEALHAIITEQSTDALAAYNEESLDLASRLDIAKAGFTDQMAILGEHLMPIMEEFISILGRVNEWFASLDEEQQKNLIKILAIVAAVGPLLLILGKLIGIIQGVAAAFTFLAANPIILVIAAIIVAIILLVKNFDRIMAVVKKVGQVFTSVFKRIGDFIGNIIRGVINTFVNMINSIINGISTILNGVFSPINALIRGANKVPGVNIPQLKITIPNIPKLDVGTNEVMGDGLAYLHKGEAVVPKKYNPAVNAGTHQQMTNYAPVIELDGRKLSRLLADYNTETIKVGGGGV